MSEPWTMALLVGLLVAGFVLSVFLRTKRKLRQVLLGAAGLFFVGNAVMNPERRYVSLLFVVLAAGFLWNSFRPEATRP